VPSTPDLPIETYDEFEGPELDGTRWHDALPPDPRARVVVGGGEARITIPAFSLADDRLQAADSVKFLALSTRDFELPATFAADLAIENAGGDPGDYRTAIACLQVADLADTHRVFSVCGTSTRVLAMHEHLAPDATGEAFIHVAESPYQDFRDDFTRFRACEVTLDPATHLVTWRVDGRTIYHAYEPHLPERARIGLGIFTMLPIRDGRSRSLRGQGMTARYRRPRALGVPNLH
jgi:hypothetical protein